MQMQISLRIERARRPFLMSSTDRSPFSRYLCSSSSSPSAAASIILARHSSHSARISAGISRYSNFVPWVESSHQISFMRIRSTTPTNLSSAPIGSWIGTAHAAQARLDLLDAAQEVGAGAVHLVDERDARHLVAVHLAPHRLGLRLHAGDRAEHCDGAVEHAQAPLHFDREVDVARGVDDVDAMLGEVVLHPLPEAGGRRGGDRDAALLLLLHVVHDRSAVVHLADLVRDAGVEKDALGRGRLPRVDVRGDADVPVSLDGRSTWHGDGLFSAVALLWGSAAAINLYQR